MPEEEQRQPRRDQTPASAPAPRSRSKDMDERSRRSAHEIAVEPVLSPPGSRTASPSGRATRFARRARPSSSSKPLTTRSPARDRRARRACEPTRDAQHRDRRSHPARGRAHTAGRSGRRPPARPRARLRSTCRCGCGCTSTLFGRPVVSVLAHRSHSKCSYFLPSFAIAPRRRSSSSSIFIGGVVLALKGARRCLSSSTRLACLLEPPTRTSKLAVPGEQPHGRER